MKKLVIRQQTSIETYEVTEGETIEQKVERLLNNKEPITDGAPPIFTDRADGVLAGYNIRTDRFEVALEGTDKITRSALAKREARAKERTGNNEPDAKIGGDGADSTSIQATDK